MISIIIVIVLSYLVGSVPTSIIFGKTLKGIDIREHGSGNAGATNVYRVMGAKIALAVLAIDICKGVLAVAVISRLGGNADGLLIKIIAGAAAIAGHIWTCFAGFKGGKGVGTSLGVFLALLPVPSLIALAAWIIVVAFSRYVSVASLSAGVVLPVSTIARWTAGAEEFKLVLFSLAVGALIWFTHIPNIRRLAAGTENRFGKK